MVHLCTHLLRILAWLPSLMAREKNAAVNTTAETTLQAPAFTIWGTHAEVELLGHVTIVEYFLGINHIIFHRSRLSHSPLQCTGFFTSLPTLGRVKCTESFILSSLVKYILKSFADFKFIYLKSRVKETKKEEVRGRKIFHPVLHSFNASKRQG